MEILKRWDYKGWAKHVIADSNLLEDTQKDWNWTLFGTINQVALQQGITEGSSILIVIPNHLRSVLNTNYLSFEKKGLFDKTITFKEDDKNVIEVNGVGIEVINFD